MKKNKSVIIASIICLLPILFGLTYYNDLPDNIVTHWGVNNEPNGYMGKVFFIFFVPILMMILELITIYFNNKKYKFMKEKIRLFYMSIIPFITITLYITTILYNKGGNIDIRKIVCFILGILIIVVGNYIPKGRMENNYFVKKNTLIKNSKAWDKIKKVYGYCMVIIGFLLIASIFFYSIVSIIAIILLILLPIIMVIYSYCCNF